MTHHFQLILLKIKNLITGLPRMLKWGIIGLGHMANQFAESLKN